MLQCVSEKKKKEKKEKRTHHYKGKIDAKGQSN